MNVRKGRIERIETPPTMKQRILKVHLSSGRAVHVPREVLELLVDTGLDVKAEITFVEKGLLGRTAWLGTPDLLPLGVVLGAISASEAAKAGWKPPLMMSREIRHLGRGRVMVVGPPQAQDRNHGSSRPPERSRRADGVLWPGAATSKSSADAEPWRTVDAGAFRSIRM